MTWYEYYSEFYGWSEVTQISRLSSVEDFGDSSEVCEIAQQFFNEKYATRLLKKALAAGVRFTAEEVIELLDFVSYEMQEQLAKTCKTKFTIAQLEELEDYGVDLEACGVDIGDYRDELEELDAQEDYSHVIESYNDEEKDDIDNKDADSEPGLLDGLMTLFLTKKLLNKNKAHEGKCTGDCANCPPHYGYRYGRWYYGHDHMEGCEFGGNSGSGK